MSMDKMQELRATLSSLKEKNHWIYSKKVQPALKEKAQEFLDAFEDYFRERGFVIRKEYHSVRVAYDTLEFTAFSKGSNDIFILKEREQIASISVKYKKTRAENPAETKDTLDDLVKEIEKEQTLATDLENPIFYYTGIEFGYQYETPITVLNSIFNV